MEKPELFETGFAADTAELPEQYLERQEGLFKARFDVLIVGSIVFHKDHVMLCRFTSEFKGFRDKIATPLYRLSRTSDENDVASLLRSQIDRPMADDISVEEYARVACRNMVGLDPGMLKSSRAATALHTALSPKVLDDSVWLRASLLWKIPEPVELKPDGVIFGEVSWATLSEVEAIPDDDFAMGFKEDIKMAFGLRERRNSSIGVAL